MLKLRRNKRKCLLGQADLVLMPVWYTYIAALFRKSRQNKANFTGTGTLQSGKFWKKITYIEGKTLQEINVQFVKISVLVLS